MKTVRCAIYTRKSSEEGLEQEFNSLHAQREACEAYVHSQRHEGWELLPKEYDDGGFSGGNVERPALKNLKDDIESSQIDLVLVYKVDRLSRSLSDFVQLVEFFDQHDVAFAAVTQQFNTSTSMGRLTLNVLLSFAQFEREVTSERIRDKIAASKKKGMWMGGCTPLGYKVVERKLVADPHARDLVKGVYEQYLALGNVKDLKHALDLASQTSPSTGKPFSRGALYTILKNPVYIGEIQHKGERYPGEHDAIIDQTTWEKTQALLTGNRTVSATKARSLSLLAGLLYDDKGNPMSPTHTRKGSKRYRYYVSQAVLQYRVDDAGSVQRISGPKLEQSVLDCLSQLLLDKDKLFEELDLAVEPTQRISKIYDEATRLSAHCSDMEPSQLKSLLAQIMSKVTTASDNLQIDILAAELYKLLTGKKPDSSKTDFSLHEAVELRRSGRESRLCLPGQVPPSSSNSIKALQSATIKGLTWAMEIRKGISSSYKEIAERESVRPEYVRHLSSLSLLSPEVLDAIVQGRVSENLTLERIKSGIPSDWEKQKSLYLL